MIEVEYKKPTDHRIRPYQELAAAVILRALLDYQPGPNRKEQTSAIQEQARDFLAGEGDFTRVRNVWCLWSGIRPESLSELVEVAEQTGVKPGRPPRRARAPRARAPQVLLQG